jgi:hypothetical protein
MMPPSSRWKTKLEVVIRFVDMGGGELVVWVLVSY